MESRARASKRRKEVRVVRVVAERSGRPSATAAQRKTNLRILCEGMELERIAKRDEPPMHATMKAAKMRPKGGCACDAGSRWPDRQLARRSGCGAACEPFEPVRGCGAACQPFEPVRAVPWWRWTRRARASS